MQAVDDAINPKTRSKTIGILKWNENVEPSDDDFVKGSKPHIDWNRAYHLGLKKEVFEDTLESRRRWEKFLTDDPDGYILRKYETVLSSEPSR